MSYLKVQRLGLKNRKINTRQLVIINDVKEKDTIITILFKDT